MEQFADVPSFWLLEIVLVIRLVPQERIQDAHWSWSHGRSTDC